MNFLVNRFVKQGFERAYDYCDPDVVIFLGDLMDEGSKATEKDYAVYIERFHRIFYRARKKKVCSIPSFKHSFGDKHLFDHFCCQPVLDSM